MSGEQTGWPAVAPHGAETVRLTLVAAGPGVAGNNAVLRILGRHPDATLAEGWGPSLVTAIAGTLAHAPGDCEAWLPVRAAHALTGLVRELVAVGEPGRRAAAELTGAVAATAVDIPIHARLFLPAELPLTQWAPLLRRALCSCGGPVAGTHLVVPAGAQLAPVVCRLLEPGDSLIATVRHPAEAVIRLTSPVARRMRPAEAVGFVEWQLDQVARVLAAAACPTLVVALEDLVLSTDAVLTRLAAVTGLPGPARWRRDARQALPEGVQRRPRWEHPAVRPHRAALAALAAAWEPVTGPAWG